MCKQETGHGTCLVEAEAKREASPMLAQHDPAQPVVLAASVMWGKFGDWTVWDRES